MKWAYDLCGAEPIIKDLLVYDATIIAEGEMVMLGTTAVSAGADGGLAAISGFVDTTDATVFGVDALGVANESKTTADVPSVATAVNSTAAQCYAKVIVNPFAVYRAEYNTATERAITSVATTSVAIGGLADNSVEGQWIYFSATAGPNYGELHMIVNQSAADTCIMDASLGATATTADKVMFIQRPNKYSNPIYDTTNGGAVDLSGSYATWAGLMTNYTVVESYMDRDQGLEKMLPNTAQGTDIKKSDSLPAKFYNDIIANDHIFGVNTRTA